MKLFVNFFRMTETEHNFKAKDLEYYSEVSALDTKINAVVKKKQPISKYITELFSS